MAITLRRPKTGLIAIEPTTSYTSIVAKYQEEFLEAKIAAENAEVAAKLRALERGDMTYKEFKAWLADLMGTYPEESQRQVDLQEVMDTAQINDLRRRDLLLQNKLTERYLSGGLTPGELLALNEERLNFLREENASVIDPELWQSAMADYADAFDAAATAGKKASGDANEELANDIRRRINELTLRYQDPTHPDPISGPDYNTQVIELFRQLDQTEEMTDSELEAYRGLEQLQRMREDEGAMIVDAVEADESGFTRVAPTTAGELFGNWAVRSVETVGGTNLVPTTKYEIYDIRTGARVRGTGTYGEEDDAILAMNELLRDQVEWVRDPVNGTVRQVGIEPTLNLLRSTVTDQYGNEIQLYGTAPGQGKSLRGLQLSSEDLARLPEDLAAEGSPAQLAKPRTVFGVEEAGELAPFAPAVALGAGGLIAGGAKVAGALGGSSAALGQPAVEALGKASRFVGTQGLRGAQAALGGVPKFTGIVGGPRGVLGAAGLAGLGASEISSAQSITKQINEARTRAEVEAALAQSASFRTDTGGLRIPSAFSIGANIGQRAATRFDTPERRYGELATGDVNLGQRIVGAIQAGAERLFNLPFLRPRR